MDDSIKTTTVGPPTRGERNNNPGNIRTGSTWQGLSLQQTDADFCVFTDPKFGIRALAKVLLLFVVFFLGSCTQEQQNRISKGIQNWTGTNGVLDVISEGKVMYRFIKIDKLTTGTATNDAATARAFRFGCWAGSPSPLECQPGVCAPIGRAATSTWPPIMPAGGQ